MKRILLMFLFAFLGVLSLVASESALQKSITEFESNLFSMPFFSEVENETVTEEMLFFAAPNNDECSGARELTPNAGFDCEKVTPVTFTDATASAQARPACVSKIAKDVWLKFTATATEHMLNLENISAPANATWVVRVILYRGGDCSGLSSAICFSLGNGINTSTSNQMSGLKVGQTYYIRLAVDDVAVNDQFNVCLGTQPNALFVSPSGGMYTVEELVKDVLISADCDLVSNIKYQVGDGSAATKAVNTLGYFNKNNSIFPFEEGIVLSTDEAQYVPGPYKGDGNYRGSNTNRWTGDQELKDAIAGAGGGTVSTTFRSTQLEFDFIPVKDEIHFEYLFTSNSYHVNCSNSGCNNGAMFAAWLIDTTTQVGENLAMVPGTNLPIALNTIRNSTWSGKSCTNENIQYYWKHYDRGVDNPLESPIDFVGLTTALKSKTVKVVPGRTYHIRLAVLDFCSNAVHTSAVFFNAGSFDIGSPSLGGDLIIENENALCPGETVEIGTDLNSNDYIIQWTKDGVDMPGENGSTLLVKERGSYGAKLNYKNVTCYSELKPIKVEYYDKIIIEKQPKNLSVCRSMDLTTKFYLDEAMVGVTHNLVEYSYYDREVDAEGANNGLPSSPYELDNAYNGPKEIWVRMQQLDDKGGYTACYEIAKFYISTKTCTIDLPQLEAMHRCGDEEFDLTEYDDVVYNGHPDYEISYYNKEVDARLENNVIDTVDAENYDGTHREIIWVRVQSKIDPNLFEVTSFELLRDKVPVVNKNVRDLTVCVGFPKPTTAYFNLRDKDNEVRHSVSNVQVDYYETEADAQLGDKTKRLPKVNYESAEKTIYARVYSMISNCADVTSLNLKFNVEPQLNGPKEYALCDDSGYATFDLSKIASELIRLNNWNYDFYKTYMEAESQSNPIVTNKGLYTNVTPGTQFVFIRVIDELGCVSIESIKLQVNSRPETSNPSTYELCDKVNGNGVLDFDLTSKESEMLGALNPSEYTITYYTDMSAANIGDRSREIQDPELFANSVTNEVYVRIENNDTGCYAIEILKLKVNDLPKVAQTIPDYEVCDSKDNSGKAVFDLSSRKSSITTDINVKVTFYKTHDDAFDDINSINEKSYVNEKEYMETVFVKVTNTKTGCFIIKTINLIVNKYPFYDVVNGGVATVCTTSNTGIGVFNLLEVAQKNIPNSAGFEIKFFESLDNADQNIKEIKSPESYSNVNVQVGSVWIRIVDNKTKCVGIYEIKLKVIKAPVITSKIPDIVVCDNLGDLFDGLATYDLTIHEGVILKDTDKNKIYRIEYYRSLDDLENVSNEINTPENYNSTSIEETIWVRLVDVDSGCEVYSSFKISANTGISLLLPPDMLKCSDLSLGQNKAIFDLTTYEDFIVGGKPVFGTKYTYYESESDALNGVNAISSNLTSNYQNKEAVQSIWIVVENEFGCRSVIVQTIIVYATPEPNYQPDALESCENEEGKGVGTFNLLKSVMDITKGDATLELAFYANKIDAENGDLNAAFQLDEDGNLQINSSSRTIYVRVENSLVEGDIACYVLVELKLKVNPIPYIREIKPYIYCLDERVEYMTFNLESKNSEVLNGRDKEDFSITYHKYRENKDTKANNRNDVLLGKDKLPYIYTNEVEFTETVWVRIEDLKTGCVNVKTFILQIEDKVEAFPVEGKEYCDDNDVATAIINDGFTRIDLTEYSADIIGNVDNAGDMIVIYYASEGDYLSGNPILTPNEYLTGTRTIIAIVKNKSDKLYCEARVEFTITVHKLPEVLPIEGGYICTDFETGEVTPLLIDSKLDSSLYNFVWLFDDVEIEGANLSYYEATKAGKYTVRTIDKVTECPSANSEDAIVKAIDAFTVTIDETKGDRDAVSTDGTQTIIVNIKESKDRLPHGVYEFALNDGKYQDSNVFYDVEAGDHLIWVRDKATGACAVSKVVSVMNYPKYFTPNGDGFNDTWNIQGLKSQPGAKVYIFDRSGKLIKQLSPSGEGWDGTYGGRPMPSTDYWFTIEYVDFNGYGREFKGHFSLKR